MALLRQVAALASPRRAHVDDAHDEASPRPRRAPRRGLAALRRRPRTDASDEHATHAAGPADATPPRRGLVVAHVVAHVVAAQPANPLELLAIIAASLERVATAHARPRRRGLAAARRVLAATRATNHSRARRDGGEA